MILDFPANCNRSRNLRGIDMPLVRAHFDKEKTEPREFGQMLFWALREIVPSAFNSDQGPLTPGSIQFIEIDTPSYGLNVDAFVEVEAYFYEDRDNNLDVRCQLIKEALNQLFPDYTFAIWPKLVRAGYASDVSDPEFDGDMSMEAAIQRAAAALTLKFYPAPR